VWVSSASPNGLCVALNTNLKEEVIMVYVALDGTLHGSLDEVRAYNAELSK